MKKPPTETMRNARIKLTQIINDACFHQRETIITRSGHPVAKVVPINYRPKEVETK